MIYAYELTLKFESLYYDQIQSLLLEQDITTFQEGEMSEDSYGNVELINENTLIKIFSENKNELENIAKHLTKELPQISTTINEITTDFNQAWKEFSNPIIVSDKILIQPSWLEFDARREIEIVLDPGLAFGAGSHETTLLCMRKLEELITKNKINTLLDVGCGSGILSILASKLGVKTITGIDIDELAISASNENAIKNNTQNAIFSTRHLSELEGSYELVVANIISSVLDSLMTDIKHKLAPNGVLVLSGLLKEELGEFKRRHGLDQFEGEVLGEWGLVWGKVLR